MVGRRVWCNMGRCSVSWLKLDRSSRGEGSSLSNGCCDRPSVGRCIGGRFTTISSSDSRDVRDRSGLWSRESSSSMLSEATTLFGHVVLWRNPATLYREFGRQRVWNVLHFECWSCPAEAGSEVDVDVFKVPRMNRVAWWGPFNHNRSFRW